jgi:radical SAM superfamily enzyme YgiQ (UPF0313 family)
MVRGKHRVVINKVDLMRDTDYTEWYKTTYPKLTGFGLWLRGGEINTLPPEEYERRFFRVLITRLSTAMDTAESSTHKLLYALVKSIPGTFPDLAYLPPKNDARFFGSGRVPWLLGTNTKRGPMDFDVIAFSNSIVQELVHIPVMLQRSGIPLQKTKRMEDESIPLVLLGGANALWTSSIWMDDPPVDGIFVGESLSCIEKLFTICRDGKLNRSKKRTVLDGLESVPGFFQPDRIRKIRKHHDPNLAEQKFFPDMPVLFIEDQPGRGTVAISEGCPSFCSFCSESYTRKPYRELPPETVIKRAEHMKAAMGLERIELSSFNFNVHSGFYDILAGLTQRFDTVGLKSMRFDVLARDPGLLPALLAAGKNSLTCGLEGISPRIRSALDKSLSDPDLSAALRQVFASPVRELKIFLIATGWEEKEDMEAFGHLLQSMTTALARAVSKPRIVFSATPLVRFPWTPLEFEDAPSADRMRECLESMGKTAAASGFEFRRAASLSEWWLSQVLVRAADQRLHPALVRSIQRTGFVYYRDVPESFVGIFRQELSKEGIEPANLPSGLDPDKPGQRPWELIETGLSRAFLIGQYKKHRQSLSPENSAGADQAACFGTDTGVCPDCGACPKEEDGMNDGRAPATGIKSSSIFAERIRDKRSASKRDEKEFKFLVRLSERARGLPRKAIGTALARALMLADPRFTDAFRRFKGSYWEDHSSSVWMTGDDVITLVFRGKVMADLTRLFENPEMMKKANMELKSWGRVNGLADREPEDVSVLIRSPYPFDGNRYLKDGRLNHVLKKTGERAYRYEFTREALRKKLIKSMSVEAPAGGVITLRLTVGAKFDPAVFAKTAFRLPHPSDWVRIEMESTMKEWDADFHG